MLEICTVQVIPGLCVCEKYISDLHNQDIWQKKDMSCILSEDQSSFIVLNSDHTFRADFNLYFINF